MTTEELLRQAFVALQVNEDFSEAVLAMRDGSQLAFCHRVGERWAKAVGPDKARAASSLAQQVLAAITRFRLNGKHLDVGFADRSNWEMRFR